MRRNLSRFFSIHKDFTWLFYFSVFIFVFNLSRNVSLCSLPLHFNSYWVCVLWRIEYVKWMLLCEAQWHDWLRHRVAHTGGVWTGLRICVFCALCFKYDCTLWKGSMWDVCMLLIRCKELIRSSSSIASVIRKYFSSFPFVLFPKKIFVTNSYFCMCMQEYRLWHT